MSTKTVRDEPTNDPTNVPRSAECPTSAQMPTPAAPTVALDERYSDAVATLNEVNGPLPAALVLACLRLRDAVGLWLEGDTPPDAVERIAGADRALRALEPRLKVLPEINAWREVLAPAADAWWWFPEQHQDGMWNVFSLFFSAVTVTLVLEIAGRFGPGDLDLLGGVLVVLPTLLAALSAGGALSRTVGARLDAWLGMFVPGHCRRAASAGLAAVVCVLAVSAWLALPWFSGLYNDRGVAALESKRLAVAEVHLRRALRLDPGNARAHYNLGDLYERLEQRQEAIREYQVAVAAGLDVAANNLGRLLVLTGKPDAAVRVLLPVERTTRGGAAEASTRYRILKNLGWARVAQGRSAEAAAHLEAARDLNPEAAAAHCLLGRTYAQLGEASQAEEAWKACLARVRELDPDEDRWIGEADAFFQEVKR